VADCRRTCTETKTRKNGKEKREEEDEMTRKKGTIRGRRTTGRKSKG
jgi:hypothetical protein